MQPEIIKAAVTAVSLHATVKEIGGKCSLPELPTPTLSVGVGRNFESVQLFVCFNVCPQHNSKKNDPKVFKLGIGTTL